MSVYIEDEEATELRSVLDVSFTQIFLCRPTLDSIHNPSSDTLTQVYRKDHYFNAIYLVTQLFSVNFEHEVRLGSDNN